MRWIIRSVFFISILGLSNNCYSQLWKQYADSAVVFSKVSEKKRATEFYLKAIKILDIDSSVTITHAAINDSLANLYLNLSEYKKADTNYLKAKEIREKLLKQRKFRLCFNL